MKGFVYSNNGALSMLFDVYQSSSGLRNASI